MYRLPVELFQWHILSAHFLTEFLKPSVDQFMSVGMGHADLSGMCQPVRIFHLFVKYFQKGRRVGSCGHEALFQHACCKMFPFQLGLLVMMLQCGTYFV